MKNIYWVIIILSFFISGCIKDFPEDDNWSATKYELVNQDSVQVFFPQIIKGKIAVVGFIYTNCPDICPLTTNNMRRIKERLEEEGIKDVYFISISFDTDFDKPNILKKYAEVRGLDLTNWQLLTGSKSEIKRLLKTAGVVAAANDSISFDDGSSIKYFVHTDRISLFDKNTHLRKNYPGSTIDIEEIIRDIKSLEEK